MAMGLFDLQTIVSDVVGHDQVKVFQKLFTRRVVVHLQILHTAHMGENIRILVFSMTTEGHTFFIVCKSIGNLITV